MEQQNSNERVAMVRIDPDAVRLVKSQAALLDRSMTDCMSEAARDWLKAQKSKGAKRNQPS